MNHSNPIDPKQREGLLKVLAKITAIEHGTLSEEFREKPSSDGSTSQRRGPYYKHQCWENGRNLSRRVASTEVETLRKDLVNGQRFEELTSQLQQCALSEGRRRRAALQSTSQEAASIQESKKKTLRRKSQRTIP